MKTSKDYAAVGLTNPKSPTNVGAVLRSAGCFQVDEIYYSGQRFERARKFHTDTQGANHKVPLLPCEHLEQLGESGVKIVCVDLVLGAVALPDFEHPERAVYIFGPEDGSISQSVIDAADHVVYIPSDGCLNLSMSVNIVLYDRSVKRPTLQADDALIAASRDQNNKTVWGESHPTGEN